MRETSGAPVQLSEQILDPTNLMIAVKRVDRERDDLVLSHVELDLLNRPDLPAGLTKEERATLVKASLLQFCESLSVALKSKGWRPKMPIYVRELKSSGVERLKPRLSFVDAVVYQAIVNLMLPKIVPALHVQGAPRVNYTAPIRTEAVLGAKLLNLSGKFSYHLREGYYQHWRAYDQVKRLGGPGGYTGARWSMSLDVSAFYDGINHEVLFSLLRGLEVEEPLISALKSGLDIWQGDEERALIGTGLPQGFEASGVLSEVYMMPVDEVLRALNDSGYRAARYVDDICVMTASDETSSQGELGLRAGPLRRISATLRGLGLHINPSKREVRRLQPWSDELLSRAQAEEEALVEQARAALEQVTSGGDERAAERAAEPLSGVSSAELPSDPEVLIERCLEELRAPSGDPAGRAALLRAGVGLLMRRQRKALKRLKRAAPYYQVTRRRGGGRRLGRAAQALKGTIALFEQMIEVAEEEAASARVAGAAGRSAELEQLRGALQALNDQSGRADVLRYLEDPQLQVTQPPEAEGGEVEEALKGRLKRFNHLIKGARSFIYGGEEGPPPDGLADLLLEVATAEELCVIGVTRLLDHFEHDEARVQRCVDLARAHASSPTARYSVYRHLAELRGWPEGYALSTLLEQLTPIEAEAPSALGVSGLIELIYRRAKPDERVEEVKALMSRLALPEGGLPQLKEHHGALLTLLTEQVSEA